MTTANKLTLFRVLLIPVFLVLAYTGHMRWALAVFVIASLTDMVDGKIKTAATMVCLCLMLLIAPPQIGDSAPDFVAQISTAVILITTVWSGVEYFWKNRDVFRHVD